MTNENIKSMLDILETALTEEIFQEDKQNIQYICKALKKIQKETPTISELEKIKKIETDLEIKYERFYELGNYFDPLYIKFKKIIRENEVKKIREENRRKREGK